MSMSDELNELRELYESGSLTEEEYQRARQLVIDSAGKPHSQVNEFFAETNRSLGAVKENQWAAIMHISQLAA